MVRCGGGRRMQPEAPPAKVLDQPTVHRHQRFRRRRQALQPAPPEQAQQPPAPAVVPAEQLAPAELTGLLGHPVVAAQAADLGHIVDLLVDGQGRVRAVVVDVGGFMGVGNRKVAVAWSALRFAAGEKGPVISILIPIDRIKSWAEYIAGRPVAAFWARLRDRSFPRTDGVAAGVARARLAVLFRR